MSRQTNINLEVDLETFELVLEGSKVFCCVSEVDYLRYGEQCFVLRGVTKGVSDDHNEAQQDYYVNVALALGLGESSNKEYKH